MLRKKIGQSYPVIKTCLIHFFPGAASMCVWGNVRRINVTDYTIKGGQTNWQLSKMNFYQSKAMH